ncbi:unnamed protein product, partial [Fusarium equiseti]
MSLAGKVVVVTGSTKGIGKAVIERVAAHGASIVINYSSDGVPAEEMVRKIGSDRALAVKADVSSIPEIEKLVSARWKSSGPYFLVQKAVPHMPRDGRIILVSTGILHNSTVAPRYLLYAASKGPIEQMTRVMAKDLGQKYDITVNCIAPGPTATEMFFQGKSQEMINMIAGFSPLNRLGKPEEIAEVAAFMAGPGSSWVSGQVIGANEGSF